MRDNIRVLLTGATSGIGECIAKNMLDAGLEVVGIGRDFSKTDIIEHEKFTGVEYDLLETEDLEEMIGVLAGDRPFDVLVNNAGLAYYGTHETLSPSMISEMVRVNLEVPMILTSLVLKEMKTNGYGLIINISSVTATGINTHGCAYGATKAGLSSFSRSLFEEARKNNIKVIDIKPDMTHTELYRNAAFDISPEEDCHLEPEDVAAAVMQAINMSENLVVTELVIRPQKHRIGKK